jgi:HSP20 family protein
LGFAFLWDWTFPSFTHHVESRIAVCDLADRGDRFELQLEVPGIEKEKIDVKATKYSVEVSGKQTEKTEEKGKNYIYNERKFQSFYRKVPVREEIMPSKVSAKMNNGIVVITLPKKIPTKEEEDSPTRVDVK